MSVGLGFFRALVSWIAEGQKEDCLLVQELWLKTVSVLFGFLLACWRCFFVFASLRGNRHTGTCEVSLRWSIVACVNKHSENKTFLNVVSATTTSNLSHAESSTFFGFTSVSSRVHPRAWPRENLDRERWTTVCCHPCHGVHNAQRCKDHKMEFMEQTLTWHESFSWIVPQRGGNSTNRTSVVRTSIKVHDGASTLDNSLNMTLYNWSWKVVCCSQLVQIHLGLGAQNTRPR